MIWDTSIWRPGCSNHSKIPSAQKCYPCSRYILLPMSPGWTREEVVGAKGFEPTSSELAGGGPNRRKSARSDQIGLIRFSFSFLFLLAFCSFSRRSYDTYMTPADPSGRNRTVRVD